MTVVLDVSAAMEIILQKSKRDSFNAAYKKGSWIITLDMFDDFIDARDLWKESLAEGIKNNHSIYDMYYAVLARRNDAVLLTNDGPLATLCKKLEIAVCS